MHGFKPMYLQKASKLVIDYLRCVKLDLAHWLSNLHVLLWNIKNRLNKQKLCPIKQPKITLVEIAHSLRLSLCIYK